MTYDLTNGKRKMVKVYNTESTAAAETGAVSRRRTVSGSVSADVTRRRNYSRTPNMSHPNSKIKKPSVSINIDMPKKPAAVPVAALRAKPSVRTVAAEKRNPFPFAVLMTAVICTMLFMYMVYNIVEINEYTLGISELKSTLSELQTREKELELKLEKKNDLSVIEEKASALGMVKIYSVSKQYVNVHNEDKIDVLTGNRSDSN